MSETLNETIPEVDTAELKAMIADHRLPLLVEYMADHCVWCQRLEPVLTATMDKFSTRVQLVKIDVDLHPDAKPTDTPRSIPTIALYRNGRLIMTKSGMMQPQ
ncbi:thioredoxin domain-containing protein, partial [Nevskia sp.]|uniref:thioredoxin family protein n=1 Tax=Nevskia sp. TaxID=1929292 RepID=UPI0025D69E76